MAKPLNKTLQIKSAKKNLSKHKPLKWKNKTFTRCTNKHKNHLAVLIEILQKV